MYKLYFYVPEDNLEKVKAAVFAAGAGRFDQYDQVAWQTKGEGQFRPLAGADPHIGKQGQLETVSEYKVEMICTEDCLKAAVTALLAAHPYEEPAYGAWKLADLKGD